MEAFLHPIVVENVGESHQTHALVVGHEGANQDVGLILRQTLSRVINSFVVTVGAQRSFFLEPSQVDPSPPRGLISAASMVA